MSPDKLTELKSQIQPSQFNTEPATRPSSGKGSPAPISGWPTPPRTPPSEQAKRLTYDRYVTLLASCKQDLTPITSKVEVLIRAHGLGLINPLPPLLLEHFARELLKSLDEHDAHQIAVASLDVPDFPLYETTLLSAMISIYLPILVSDYLLSLPKPPWSPLSLPTPTSTSPEEPNPNAGTNPPNSPPSKP